MLPQARRVSGAIHGASMTVSKLEHDRETARPARPLSACVEAVHYNDWHIGQLAQLFDAAHASRRDARDN
jgi:hypothetical protein